MPKEYSRTQRIADLIQRELAMIIQKEIKDPRLGMITVSMVEVTRDLSSAKVYVTCLEEGEKIKESLKILNKASSFLRYKLAQAIELRTMPQLRFFYDESVSRGSKLFALIDKVVNEDKKRNEEN